MVAQVFETMGSEAMQQREGPEIVFELVVFVAGVGR